MVELEIALGKLRQAHYKHLEDEMRYEGMRSDSQRTREAARKGQTIELILHSIRLQNTKVHK